MHGLVVSIREEVIGVDGVDKGGIELFLVECLELTLGLAGSVVEQLINEGGAASDRLVGELNKLERERVGRPEFDRVDSLPPVVGDIVLVRDEGTGDILAPRASNVGLAVEKESSRIVVEVGVAVKGASCEVVMKRVGVRVDEVEPWVGSNIGDEKLDESDLLSAGYSGRLGKCVKGCAVEHEAGAASGREFCGWIERGATGARGVKLGEIIDTVSIGIPWIGVGNYPHLEVGLIRWGDGISDPVFGLGKRNNIDGPPFDEVFRSGEDGIVILCLRNGEAEFTVLGKLRGRWLDLGVERQQKGAC